MPSLHIRHLLLLGVNVLIGLVAIGAVTQQRHARSEELQALRQQAVESRQHCEARAQEVSRQQAVLEGLRADDPYVIELLARQRLGATRGPEEIIPPRLTPDRR